VPDVPEFPLELDVPELVVFDELELPALPLLRSPSILIYSVKK
jgi:hypothetical protein